MENPFDWKIVEHNGRKIHEGVHALIKRSPSFLLVSRRFPPFGYSMVSGHVHKGEEPESALVREVQEELRAKAVNPQFLITAEQNDICPMIFYKHFNYVYSCEILGEPKINFESRGFGWFAPEDLAKLNLTGFTRKVFKNWRILE